MAQVKMCIICKKYIPMCVFVEHFRDCRKKQLKKIQPTINKRITKSRYNNTVQPKRDCGCQKKKPKS